MPERLLVVDDEEANRDVLSRRLQRNGFTVEAVENGLQALSRLAESTVDLVLLDSMMPGMTGMEVLKRVREHRSPDQLPVIMVTAVSESARIAEAFRLGANDYVTKPVDFEVALARIRSQLDRKQAESALRDSEERYALAARGSNDGLWDWDVEGSRIHLSARWKAMLGYAEDEIGIDPKEWFTRVHPDDVAALRHRIEAHWSGSAGSLECEYRIRHKNGAYLWMLGRGIAVLRGPNQPVRMAGSQTDVTNRKTLDPLTGLPNRILFNERVLAAMDLARSVPGRSFAVLFLDLDRFKLINDTLGHAAGDQLLVEVGARLRNTVPPNGSGCENIVARLGGDEFAILIEGTQGIEAPGALAERILGAMRVPCTLDGRGVHCSASIGVALWEDGYTCPEDVIGDADMAMYAAKAKGKQCWALFDHQMRDRVTSRMEMEQELRTAVADEQLEVHYQPRVELGQGRIRGFEALVRWQHPVRGMVRPDAFIPIAEETGQIREIGLWVLRRACLQLKQWQTEYPLEPPVTMSVNVSPAQCRDLSFIREVADVLRETGVDARSLQLELTESMLIESLELAQEILKGLRALGVELKLDDFGTGYSSLQYLARLPFDMLKIDRSFILALDGSSSSEELIRTILAMAHNLNMKVVAEGVETLEHWTRLKTMGCEFGQGFYFSKPLAAHAAGELLQGGGVIAIDALLGGNAA